MYSLCNAAISFLYSGRIVTLVSCRNERVRGCEAKPNEFVGRRRPDKRVHHAAMVTLGLALQLR